MTGPVATTFTRWPAGVLARSGLTGLWLVAIGGCSSPGPVPKPGSPLYMGTSSDLVGGFATFGFGFHDWHPQKTFDIYSDDVVFDSKRVGCLP